MEYYVTLGISNFLAIITALIIFLITELIRGSWEKNKIALLDEKNEIALITNEYFATISEVSMILTINKNKISNPLQLSANHDARTVESYNKSGLELREAGVSLYGFIIKHKHKEILKKIDTINLNNIDNAYKLFIGLSNSLFYINENNFDGTRKMLNELTELLDLKYIMN